MYQSWRSLLSWEGATPKVYSCLLNRFHRCQVSQPFLSTFLFKQIQLLMPGSFFNSVNWQILSLELETCLPPFGKKLFSEIKKHKRTCCWKQRKNPGTKKTTTTTTTTTTEATKKFPSPNLMKNTLVSQTFWLYKKGQLQPSKVLFLDSGS